MLAPAPANVLAKPTPSPYEAQVMMAVLPFSENRSASPLFLSFSLVLRGLGVNGGEGRSETEDSGSSHARDPVFDRKPRNEMALADEFRLVHHALNVNS